MGATTKVKRSKLLRYKLISILYLLFITLSALQIPDDWTRVSREIHAGFNQVELAEEVEPLFKGLNSFLSKIQADFDQEIQLDPETGLYPEPKGYSKTDRFFLKGKHGEAVHDRLRSFYQSQSQGNSERSAKVKLLFAEDVNHGLLLPHADKWTEYRFKHVPVVIARTFLEEIQLKLKLIAGLSSKEIETKEARPILRMAMNISRARIGEKIRFYAHHNTNWKGNLVVNGEGQTVDLPQGDSLIFIPSSPGWHEFTFTHDQNVEKIAFEVYPGSVHRLSDPEVRGPIFIGQEVEFGFTNAVIPETIRCSCDSLAILKPENHSFTIKPTDLGWCTMELNSSNGLTLVKDSIFVEALPKPFVYIPSAPDGILSHSRLKTNPNIKLQALFPLGKASAEVIKFTYTLVGTGGEEVSVPGNEIQLNEIPTGLRFIYISNIRIQSGNQSFEPDAPIILEINPS